MTAESFARAIERTLTRRCSRRPRRSWRRRRSRRGAGGQGGTAPAGSPSAGTRSPSALTEAAPDFLARIGDAVLLRGAGRPADRPEGATRPRVGAVLRGVVRGPTGARSCEAQPLLPRRPAAALGRDADHAETVDTRRATCRCARVTADLDLAGLPPARHGQLTQQYGINKGRYFVDAVQTHSVRRAQHDPTVLQGRRPPGRPSPTRSTARR